MANAPIVASRTGKLEGTHEGGVYVFRGVPYAEPPIGPRRWLAPEPVEPWEGVRPATQFGNVCHQEKEAPSALLRHILPVPHPHSEDCLNLNVWTPGLDDAKRPVMVWIHPGGWEFGAGSQPNYDGTKLAVRGEVVVVTLNFRLGAFGFLRFNEITDGEIPSTGNEGSLDQIAALQWVHENIAAFGGDPDNVTVLGESSGSVHCAFLLASPLTRGLINRVILESSFGHTAHSVESADRVTRLFLDQVGVEPNDIDGLLALKPAQLVAASTALPAAMLADESPHPGIMHYHPVIDGVGLLARPIDMVRDGTANDVSLMAGSNRDEHRIALSAEVPHIAAARPVTPTMEQSQARDQLTFIPPERRQELMDTYRISREKTGEPSAPIDILMAVETDRVLRIPKIKLLEARHARGNPAYGYLLTWQSPALGGILGAAHWLEVGFLFGSYDEHFCGKGPDADEFATKIQDSWVAFARTGDPSNDNIGQWPTYGDNRETMLLGKPCKVVNAPFEDERLAWDGVPDDALGLM